MNEYLEEAKEELKRVDHIIYVSLKYTRTVDVIRNAVHRLVSAFDFIIEGILWYHQQQKRIKDIPKSPKVKIDVLKSLYPGDLRMEKYILFYLFLRELVIAHYDRREEYRRYVTMISKLDRRTAEVDIDVLEDNFDMLAKEFLDYAEITTGIKQIE